MIQAIGRYLKPSLELAALFAAVYAAIASRADEDTHYGVVSGFVSVGIMFFAIFKGFMEASAIDKRFDGIDKRFDGIDKRFDDLLAALKGRCVLDTTFDPLHVPPVLLDAPVSHPAERGPPRGTVVHRTGEGAFVKRTYETSEVLAPHPAGDVAAICVDQGTYDRAGMMRRFKTPKA